MAAKLTVTRELTPRMSAIVDALLACERNGHDLKVHFFTNAKHDTPITFEHEENNVTYAGIVTWHLLTRADGFTDEVAHSFRLEAA